MYWDKDRDTIFFISIEILGYYIKTKLPPYNILPPISNHYLKLKKKTLYIYMNKLKWKR